MSIISRSELVFQTRLCAVLMKCVFSVTEHKKLVELEIARSRVLCAEASVNARDPGDIFISYLLLYLLLKSCSDCEKTSAESCMMNYCELLRSDSFFDAVLKFCLYHTEQGKTLSNYPGVGELNTSSFTQQSTLRWSFL